MKNTKDVNPEQDEIVDFWDEIEVEEEDAPDIELKEDQLKDPEEVEADEDEELDEEDESEEADDSEETDESEDDDSEDSLIQSLVARLGLEFEREFEDTEEGVQELVEEASKLLADQAVDQIFSQYPEVKELFEYRRLGGDPDKFFQTKFPEVDFSEVEFKEDDEAQHEFLIKQELAARGYTPDEISAELEDYRNGGILESKARRALNALQVKQQEDKSNLLEKQREEARRLEEEVEQFWTGVKKTIEESSTFKSFMIPSSDKEKFFEYISKPVKDGKSQRDLDVEQSDLETRLAIDFLLYKGFNLSEIIDRRAKDKNAKSLRERLRKSKLSNRREDRIQSGVIEELDTL